MSTYKNKLKFVIVRYDEKNKRYSIMHKIGDISDKKIAESLAEKFSRNDNDRKYIVWSYKEYEKYVNEVRDKLKKLRAFLTKKFAYKNMEDIYIHISPTEIKDVKNTNEKMRLSNKYFNYNPSGLWFSCGIEWIDLLLSNSENMVNYNINYAYQFNLNESKIYNISTKNQFFKLINDYQKKLPEGLGDIMNSNKIRKDYSGLKICPYRFDVLNPVITETVKGESIRTQKVSKKILSKVLGKDITVEKYNLMTEWYRHWDVASGVIWNKNGLDSLKLLAKYDVDIKKWNFE